MTLGYWTHFLPGEGSVTGFESSGEKTEMVWTRIVKGDRARIFQDFYGGQWVELTPRWQLWRRRRVRLSPQEMAVIKSALRETRQVDARRVSAMA